MSFETLETTAPNVMSAAAVLFQNNSNAMVSIPPSSDSSSNTTITTASAVAVTDLAINPYPSSWYLVTFYVIIFISMVLVAAGGNLIVIWIVLAHKRMRTVTNYFLVNLAMADALISILNTLFNFVYMVNSNWYFGRWYCKFSLFIATCTISASVFTFMAIAIDRYIAIIHPLKPRMSAKKVLLVICIVWLAGCLLAAPNVVYGTTYTWQYGNHSRTVCYVDLTQQADFIYNLIVMLVNYFIPMSILSGTYFLVGRELWGSRAIGEFTYTQQESVRSKRRVVKMMIVVVAIFGICWLPQHTYFLVSNQHPNITHYPPIQHIYLCIYWLAMSNSMYNPIIYCWMNARFRKGFKSVFRFLPCVNYGRGDKLEVGVTTRTSLSEGTRFERNGSLMQTMIESLDESTYTPGVTGVNLGNRGVSWSKKVKEDTL